MPKLIMDPKESTEVVTPSTEVTAEPTAENKEVTLQEALGTQEPKVEEKKDDMVPLSKYMETKNALKEAQKAIEALQSNPSKTVAPADIVTIADKYGIDPEALSDLASVLESRARESVKQELAPQLKEIEDAKNADKFEKTFEKLWSLSLESNPEFDDVANKETIKQLALLPQNRNLTLTQLLEQTYGQVVNKGKKTLETATPSANKQPDNINFAHPSSEEWEMIKSNPELKKQYNDYIVKNLRF